MLEAVLRPADIGPEDSERILSFLNGVTDVANLAQTIGLSEGAQIGARVAAELLAARGRMGRFRTLDQVLSVTGVTLARFTEIAIALSGAQAPLGGVQVRFVGGTGDIWLGQSAQFSVQVTDAGGQAVLDRSVTCLASAGVLSARVGLQVQKGTALSLRPEVGGLVRLSFEPSLDPPLSASEKAALAAELSNLDSSAASPQDDVAGLRRLAARYRGQAAKGLQKAVDQLFEAAPPPKQPNSSPWPVQPATVLALIHGPDGQVTQSATLTINIRNWLGGFYAALRDELRENSPLRAALQVLTVDAEAGRDLSRKLIQATQSFSALERGVIGRELRVAATGETLNGFLAENAGTLKGDAIVNTVRAAGASEAAIAAGGFAVFEAIRTVQDAGDVIAPGKGVGLDALDPFDRRLGALEESVVTRDDLSRFETDFSTRIDVRFDNFAETAVTEGDLDQLRVDFSTQLDTRIKAVEDSRVSNDRFATFDAVIRRDMDTQLGTRLSRDEFTGFQDEILERVGSVEATAITEGRLTTLRGEINRDVDSRIAGRVSVDEFKSVADGLTARLDTVQASAVSRDQLDEFAEGLTAKTQEQLATVVQRAEFDELGTNLRKELNERLDAGLNRDEFSQMFKDFEAKFEERLKTVEERAITDERLVRSTEDLRAHMDAQVATRMPREEFEANFKAFQDEVEERFRGKANARTVADLRISVNRVNDLHTQLKREVEVIDTKVNARRGGGGGVIR